MLTIFGHSENSHIVFLWANYIGYKRRTLGAMDMGTKCGAIGNTHFPKKNKKNSNSPIVAKSMTLSFIMIYDPFKNYS